jgi:hypothetical protein
MGPLPVYALAIVRAAGGRSLSDVVFSKGRSVYWPPLRHDSSCYVKDGLSWQPSGAVLRALSLYTAALEASPLYGGRLFHLWYADSPSDVEKTVILLTSANGTRWQTARATSFNL